MYVGLYSLHQRALFGATKDAGIGTRSTAEPAYRCAAQAAFSLAQTHDIGFVALRIGLIRPGENQPGPHLALGLWGQQMWLSNRDFSNGVERALLAPLPRPEIVNLMSDNPGMPWDIDHTRQAIGYAPRDGHVASISEGQSKGAEALERSFALQAAMIELWNTHAF